MTHTTASTHPIRAYGRSIAGLSRNAKLYLSCSLLRAAALAVFELFFNLYLLSLRLAENKITVTDTKLNGASKGSLVHHIHLCRWNNTKIQKRLSHSTTGMMPSDADTLTGRNVI